MRFFAAVLVWRMADQQRLNLTAVANSQLTMDLFHRAVDDVGHLLADILHQKAA